MIPQQTISRLPPNILAQYLRDPRLAQTQQQIEEGSSSAPVRTPLEGLARMLKGGLGAYQMRKMDEGYAERGSKYSSDLAELLRKGSTDEMIAAASQNPDLADIGTQLALKKAGGFADLQNTMMIEQLKQSMDPKQRFLNDILGGAPAPTMSPQAMPTMTAQNMPDLPAMPPSGAINAQANIPSPPMDVPMNAGGSLPPVPPPDINATLGQSTEPQPDASLNAAMTAMGMRPPNGYQYTKGPDGRLSLQKLQPPLNSNSQSKLIELQDGILAGENTLKNFADARNLIGKTISGPLADQRQMLARSFGGKPGRELAAQTQQLHKIMGTEVMTALNAMKGPATEREYSRLEELTAKKDLSPEEQGRVLDEMEKLTKQIINKNKALMNDIRSGALFTGQGAQSDINDEELMNELMSRFQQ